MQWGCQGCWGGCGCAVVLGLSRLLYVHGAGTGRWQGQEGTGPQVGGFGPPGEQPQGSPAARGQPSQGSPRLLGGHAGWREGVGRGNDVPVAKSLTPSREPSAYMKGDQPPLSWLGVAPPPSGTPQARVRGSRHVVWGRNASFCQRLRAPSCMARVLVGSLSPACCSSPSPALSPHPGMSPGTPRTPATPAPHQPLPGTAPALPRCHGVPGVALSPCPCVTEGLQGPAGDTALTAPATRHLSLGGQRGVPTALGCSGGAWGRAGALLCVCVHVHTWERMGMCIPVRAA